AEIRSSRPIGYVTYGNPMSYDRVAQNLLEYAKDVGFSTQIIPGISSLDSVLCDLGIDMAPAIQIFEASWLLACHIPLNIRVPVLLMQMGAFGSLRTHYTKRTNGSSLNELVEYLRLFYPPFHRVSLVRSSGQDGRPSLISQIELEHLCEVSADEL